MNMKQKLLFFYMIFIMACSDDRGGSITVSFTTEPLGASVEIYHRHRSVSEEPNHIGITPFELILSGPTNLILRISREDYESMRAWTTIGRNTEKLHFDLTIKEIYAKVNSSPQGASVTIDGEEDVCQTPCEIKLTYREHEFIFSLEGYEQMTIIHDIDLGHGTVDVDLRKLISINIDSDPTGAQVIIDESQDENYFTPFEVTLPEGEHKLHYKLEGYHDYTEVVEVNRHNTSFFAELESLIPLEYEVFINSNPQGAMVTIDNDFENVYITPFNINLLEGEYEFLFELDGYRTEIFETPIDRYTETILIILEHAEKVLLYSDPQMAWVEIDNQPDVCQTPCHVELSPDPHHFVFSLPGYDILYLDETISDSNNLFLVEFLNVPEVFVTVASAPQGVTVLIDSRETEYVTPFQVYLKEGWHFFSGNLVYDSIEVLTEVSAEQNYVFIDME